MEDPWANYKEILKHHFLTEDKTLKDVQKFMNDTYNFRARYASAPDSGGNLQVNLLTAKRNTSAGSRNGDFAKIKQLVNG
jgi:hypothetical protein